MRNRQIQTIIICIILIRLMAARTTHAASTLYSVDFAEARRGAIPDAWRDAIDDRANPSWGIDGRGFLRTLLKNYEGTILYEGALADGTDAIELADASAEAVFEKSLDNNVSISVIGRVQNRDNYYGARFSGFNKLELLKMKDGTSVPLADFVTLEDLQLTKLWRLKLEMTGEHLTARVFDNQGVEQSRVDALDSDFKAGRCGLRATEFAAAKSFRLEAPNELKQTLIPEEIAAKNRAVAAARGIADYAVVKPAQNTATLNASFDRLAENHDVIVAGAGTGGSAAAIQAARLGAKVLLIEESDWIGGQMSAAAVTTMDEEGLWFQFPVRERGIYREFHESMVNFYFTLQKDPFRAYSSYPIQTEGGYEPKMTRAMLYALMQDARQRGSRDGKPGVLDVCLDTRVAAVEKEGGKIAGVKLENWEKNQPTTRTIRCSVLIDATEYGDVLPLTGARYRIGNCTSDKIDPSALMQDNTWCAVVREYPQGIPENLVIKNPPPDYEKFSHVFKKYQRWGAYLWGAPGKGVKGPRDWRVWVHWRGMADSDSPMTGMASEFRHTEAGVNGGNDYPMTVGGVEDPEQRIAREREGIYRTLSVIYYFQHEVGLNWALAEDEGYNTAYNQRMMKARDLRPDLYEQAIRMPQWPYVRESRRGIGLYTLRASDLERFEKAKLFPTSVAMGDYFMDLHKSDEAIEKELDTLDPPKGGGPFQVPFEAFIPEKIDGLVFAEKNISQSRLVNGATRLQPITMLTGQAAGTIAALAVERGVSPRALRAVDVQQKQLESGSTLIARWYVDVLWGTEIWRHSQLLSLYGILDRPGPLKHREGPLREGSTWGVNEPVSRSEVDAAIAQLMNPMTTSRQDVPVSSPASGDHLSRQQIQSSLVVANPDWKSLNDDFAVADENSVTRREFATVCVRILTMPKK